MDPNVHKVVNTSWMSLTIWINKKGKNKTKSFSRLSCQNWPKCPLKIYAYTQLFNKQKKFLFYVSLF
jgi:hypothetical protein